MEHRLGGHTPGREEPLRIRWQYKQTTFLIFDTFKHKNRAANDPSVFIITEKCKSAILGAFNQEKAPTGVESGAAV